ncbi:MAG: glycosyltransferase family 39 protein, partial [Lachnospiraceae bacterium]|nr:glycosyltransferase family 39 protein [Lachnospiraceae bacterium]
MRIIDYYNIVVSILTVGIALFFLGKKVVRQKGGYPEQAAADCRPVRLFVQKEKDRLSALGLVCFFLVFALGCFLRFYHLTRLPDGLNQDEASIGYEAFSLAFYGVDRYGNPFPVYPITWGSGGGSPLLIYLTALSFKLFGVSIFVLRGTVAFFGCLTLPLFYLLVKEAKSSLSGLQSSPTGLPSSPTGLQSSPTGLQSSPVGLLGMLLLAIAPWHILLTRWTLDYGLIPFTFGLAILVLMKAARRQSTGLYVLASAMAALNMYSYGSANIVIPAFLLLSVFFLMRGKILSVRQLFLCMLMFLLVCAPLFLFYFINVCKLPEIITPFFSVERFRSDHTASVFLSFSDLFLRGEGIKNSKELLLYLSVGVENGEYYTYMPGYWTFYVFTFPITLIGFVVSLKRMRKGRREATRKEQDAATDLRSGSHSLSGAVAAEEIVFSAFLASFLFGLTVRISINHIIMVYLPLLYYTVCGYDAFMRVAAYSASGKAGGRREKFGRQIFLFPALTLWVGFLFFARDYYGGRYNALCADSIFFRGYGEACVYAEEAVKKEAGSPSALIYSTSTNMISPFMIAVFYTRMPPAT